jgi:hypothetical protein
MLVAQTVYQGAMDPGESGVPQVVDRSDRAGQGRYEPVGQIDQDGIYDQWQGVEECPRGTGLRGQL